MEQQLFLTHILSKFHNEEGPESGFLLVILDVNVDDMGLMTRLCLGGWLEALETWRGDSRKELNARIFFARQDILNETSPLM